MESLKPLLLLVVLGGVGYGVYVALNHAPPPELSTLAPEWNKPAATETGGPNGVADNRAVGGNAVSSAPLSNPWQTGATAGRSTVDASRPASGPSPTSGHSDNSTSSGSTIGSLPFGLGSNSPNPPMSDSPPSQTPPLAVSGSQNQAANLNGGGNLEHPTDAGKSTGDSPSLGAPYSAAPNSEAPDPGAPNSNAANLGAPDQAVASPAVDAQIRHDYESSKRTVLTLLNQGQLVEALRELSKWYGNTSVPPEDEPHLIELLSQLAGTVIYSRDPWLGPPYQVRVGESLESIAQQYQVPWQLLAKINGLQNPNGLLPGEKLKIVHGPFQAQLNVRQGWLALFVDGLYAGRFRVQATDPVTKPDGDYPVVKFSAGQLGAGGNQAPYISLGGDLHLRVPEDALPPGVTAIRINRQDMDDVFDMLSERSQVTIVR